MTTADRATGVQVPIVRTTSGRRSRSVRCTSLWRRAACSALIVTVLSFSTAYAQQEGASPGAQDTSAWAEFSRPGNSEAGVLTKETRLRRTVLRPAKLPGFDQEPQPAAGGGSRISLAQGGNAALQDGQNGGLPWWAWALIGAGVATAAMQLEFRDEANEGEDD